MPMPKAMEHHTTMKQTPTSLPGSNLLSDIAPQDAFRTWGHLGFLHAFALVTLALSSIQNEFL